MDVLSEVLKAVKLDGAVFYNGEFSAPWCAHEPDSPTMASYLSVGAKHVIIFHLITEGRAYARMEGIDRPVSLTAGDIVVFPRGDAHIMGNGSPVAPMDSAGELQRVLSEGVTVSRCGGGGALTKIICGYMTCDLHLSHVFLSGLPPILKVNIRNDESGRWLEQSIRHSIDRADAASPGLKLSVPSYRKCCLSKRCGATSTGSRRSRPDGWPVSATLTSGGLWHCCIAGPPIPGRSPLSRPKSAHRAPSWPNDSDGISRKPPSPT